MMPAMNVSMGHLTLSHVAPQGPLVNDRIRCVAYELHPTFDPRRVRVTSDPFLIQRQGWDEFQVGVSVQLLDTQGFTQTVELEHDLLLEKDIATTIYKIEECLYVMGMPFVCTKIETSNELLVPEDKLPASTVAVQVNSVQSRRTLDSVADQSQCCVLTKLSDEAIVAQLCELGRGSFGVVVKASTNGEGGLPETVAVKQLFVTTGDANNTAFWLEAKVLASLPAHRNVVQLFGWCKAFGKPSLIFELCEEGDLTSFLKRSRKGNTTMHMLEPVTVFDLTRQIAAGMSHVHANRLYHRDLKPNNVLLTRKGVVGPSGLRAVITDLGLAKNIEAEIHLSQSVAGSQVGTYMYMAPETISKSVFSQGSDVWSFAAVVWELLTGRAPYSYMGEINPVAVAFQVGFGSLAPESLPWPAPFDTILTKAFARNHHDRPSFKDILKALDTQSQGFGGLAPSEFVAMQKHWESIIHDKYGKKQRASTRPSSLLMSPSVCEANDEDPSTPTFGSPVCDIGSPSIMMMNGIGIDFATTTSGSTSGSTIGSTTVGSMKLDAVMLADVAAVVGGGFDYTSILAEYGFTALDDFEIYTEAELIQMGFKMVHARKLLRASIARVSGGTTTQSVVEVCSSSLRTVETMQSTVIVRHTPPSSPPTALKLLGGQMQQPSFVTA